MHSRLVDEKEAIEVYALFWRLVHLSVHRYGSHPTAELLIVLTIMLLDRVGANPTVSELAEITGLPKSSVSRYISNEMRDGFLEETIDPVDRRRRYLSPTSKARKEQQWHLKQIRKIVESCREVIDAADSGGKAGINIRGILQDITARSA